jgi:hypothetical protein
MKIMEVECRWTLLIAHFSQMGKTNRWNVMPIVIVFFPHVAAMKKNESKTLGFKLIKTLSSTMFPEVLQF